MSYSSGFNLKFKYFVIFTKVIVNLISTIWLGVQFIFIWGFSIQLLKSAMPNYKFRKLKILEVLVNPVNDF